MRGLLERLIRRPTETRESLSADAPPIKRAAPDDRRLARAIARAADHGHGQIADQLSASATPRLHASTCLTEEVARQHLRRGRPHRAINVLDAGPAVTDSRRLLRAICLIEAGRREEAALDLCGWTRSGTAPLDALLILAHEAWDAGDLDVAADLLHRSLAISEDPLCIELLLLLAIDRDRPLSARRWFERLRETPSMLLEPAPLSALGMLLGLGGQDVTPRVTEQSVRALALELAGSPAALPALVHGAIESRRTEVIRLILGAVERPESDLTDDPVGYEARVRCLMALDRFDEARAVLRAAREQRPLAASLARLENDLSAATSEPRSAHASPQGQAA